MPRIKIEQLDSNGNTWRTFEQFPTAAQVADRLHSITYAYNLDHTRVSVDGKLVPLTRETAATREP